MTTRRSSPQSHSLFEEIKARASLLRKSLAAPGEPALAAARRFQRLARLTDEPAEAIVAGAASITHGQALAVIAGELGYPSFEECKADVDARQPDATAALADVLARRLYPQGASAHLNRWVRTYPEARAAQGREFLLSYEHQFFLCGASFIEQLGLRADDPDWERIGRDWVRPADIAAWRRLNARTWQAPVSNASASAKP